MYQNTKIIKCSFLIVQTSIFCLCITYIFKRMFGGKYCFPYADIIIIQEIIQIKVHHAKKKLVFV